MGCGIKVSIILIILKGHSRNRVHLMPKSKRPRQPTLPPPLPLPQRQPVTAAQLMLGYNPNGPSKQRDIVSVKNGWSEYELDDGTTIRTKGVLVDVKRML